MSVPWSRPTSADPGSDLAWGQLWRSPRAPYRSTYRFLPLPLTRWHSINIRVVRNNTYHLCGVQSWLYSSGEKKHNKLSSSDLFCKTFILAYTIKQHRSFWLNIKGMSRLLTLYSFHLYLLHNTYIILLIIRVLIFHIMQDICFFFPSRYATIRPAALFTTLVSKHFSPTPPIRPLILPERLTSQTLHIFINVFIYLFI